jgi:hypothetical protein
MDPIVTGAAIGLAGAVVGAVGAYLATVRNTSKTIEHEREKRVWDRRANVYVEALAAVHYRQIARVSGIRAYMVHPSTSEREREQVILASYKPPDWHELEARLQAFASEPVMTAMQASSTAHRQTMDVFHSWEVRDTGSVVSGEDVGRALKAAEAADDAVVELIRTELQGRGRPLGDWQPTTSV